MATPVVNRVVLYVDVGNLTPEQAKAALDKAKIDFKAQRDANRDDDDSGDAFYVFPTTYTLQVI